MKKMLILSLTALLMLSSCGSYEASGAFAGAHFGSIVGSAIGGISGGWHGRDVGTLIGMAGGAAVGAAIGAAADNAESNRANSPYPHRFNESAGVNQRQSQDESGYDPQGRGDDRITLDGVSAHPGYMADGAALVVSNLRMVDATRDGELTRGEDAHIVFEIRNTSDKPVFSVLPSVREVTGNRHIHISENVLVECIKPNETIRYTAQVKADGGLRNGEAVVRVTVFQAGRELSSQTRNLRILTFKR